MAEFYRRGYGAAVTVAIDKFVYVAVHRVFGSEFVLKHNQVEVCEQIASIQHPLIRECLLHTQTREPLEIATFADIPSSGTGLGSSSSLAISLLHALYAQQGRSVDAERCASDACMVEIERLNEPVGKMDQYASAYGGLNYLRFNADGSVHVEPILLSGEQMSELSGHLVLFYTGLTRRAASVLTEQKANVAVSEPHVRLVSAMRDQADHLRGELLRGNLSAVGEVMHEAWQLKRQVATGVSNPQLDDIYARALAAGARGGKLLGAGGGGFFLFSCAPERRQALIAALGDLRHVPFRLEGEGTRIVGRD